MACTQLPPNINRPALADQLGLSPRSFDRYQATGAGPALHGFGSVVRYRRKKLEAWAKYRRPMGLLAVTVQRFTEY